VPARFDVKRYLAEIGAGIGLFLAPLANAAASQDHAARAAIHPVATSVQLEAWLARVPVTREWPPDFAEMSTAPGCLPCADLWTRLGELGRRYGWQVRTIASQEAMTRSGRLGLPWVGHPVAWVRPIAETRRMVPVAIGTDHGPNLARNLYLAAKMLTGVRPAVGVRGMARFTGIVGLQQRRRRPLP
jgi:hypothetical protein